MGEVSARDHYVDGLAEAMFAAYNDAGEKKWQTFDGRQVPHWSELSEDVRTKWTAAAKVAVDRLPLTPPPPK